MNLDYRFCPLKTTSVQLEGNVCNALLQPLRAAPDPDAADTVRRNTVCLASRRMGRIDHMKALSDSLTSCSFKAFETDNNYNLLHKKRGRTFAASVGASERCGLSGKGKCWSFL
ncbi:hypothetical protein QQF64_010667 [Cirrhinus molitorella]|uniref:Uncharacterized protein n=1 Tax=Cirrhinus molitorella TaxID=172907 RepID=A0ABR3LX11_9TELE